jgi:hypothetical protein
MISVGDCYQPLYPNTFANFVIAVFVGARQKQNQHLA